MSANIFWTRVRLGTRVASSGRRDGAPPPARVRGSIPRAGARSRTASGEGSCSGRRPLACYSWEESQEYADLEAATKESALEEVRRRQVQLVALDDELFNQVPLWHPLLGMPELRAKILARARWQRALDMLKVCKACCSASGTQAWDLFLMDEVD